MSNFKPFVFGSMVGAALAYTGLQYHLVHSNDGFYLVPRAPQASLGLAYADVRGMTEEQLSATPELARAMTAHSTRRMLADSTEPAAQLDSFIDRGTDALDDARVRMRETVNQWDDEISNAVPTPQGTDFDAPIWNPFSDDRETDNTSPGLQLPGSDDARDALDSIFPSSSNDEIGATAWPTNDKVATQFEGDSPFSDITEQVGRTRESFTSQTRELAKEFRSRTETLSSGRTGVKPFDFAADAAPTHQTNRISAPAAPAAPVTESLRNIPLFRDDQARDSLNRRAREIYEQSRRRATEPIDGMIDRARSRANSVIDELVGPGNSTADELIDRAARSANPQPYRRGN